MGDGRRLGPHPPPRNAAEGVRGARHLTGRSAEEIRLPAEFAAVRRAAAWRHRVRARPHRDDDVRRRIDSRRDRISEDAARTGPADRHSGAGHRAATARPAYQDQAIGCDEARVAVSCSKLVCMFRARPMLRAAAGFMLAVVFFAGTEARARATPDALPEITVAALPGEAREVLVVIRSGGPFRFDRDGVV